MAIAGEPESRVVAVTGGMGSGKSTASSLFRENGAVVVSADELAHRVVKAGSPVLSRVVATFGSGVLAADGGLDRKALGSIVFADPAQRRRLEEIIHPAIRELSSNEFCTALASGSPLVVYDCPLFFEAGLDALGFRAIVVVDASPAVCVERVVQRDGLSPEAALARIAAQMPLAEKVQRGTHVIRNDGSLAELRREIERLYRYFTQQRPG